MNEESAGDLDPTELDLSSVVTYMRRNNLTSVKLRIEDAAAGMPGAPALLAEEWRVMADEATPSDLGLEGVFFVARV